MGRRVKNFMETSLFSGNTREMQSTKRRPLPIIFLGIATGIFLAGTFGLKTVPIWPIPVGITLAAVTIISTYSSSGQGLATFTTITLSVILGLTSFSAHYFDPTDLYPELSTIESIEGIVTSFPKQGQAGQELTINLTNRPGKLKVYLANQTTPTDQEKSVDFGDRIELTGNFTVPDLSGEFNYREFLREKKIWGVVYDGKILDTHSGRVNPLLKMGWKARKIAFSRIDNLFPERGNYLKALLFGAKDYLGESEVENFNKTGLAHLLAASGLHLGILIGGGWLLFTGLGFRRTSIYLFSLPALLLYLMMVGFKLPLTRATLLYVFSGAGVYCRDKGIILSGWYDLYQSIAAAGIILLLYHPSSLNDAGFQLSFGATFAIAYLLPPIRGRLEPIKPGYLRDTFSASIAAQLGVVPIIAAHFHQIHPWSVVFNLIAIPGVTVILYLGVISLIGGSFLLIGKFITELTSGLICWYDCGLTFISNVPYSQIDLGKVNTFALAAYLIAIFWFRWKLVEANPGLLNRGYRVSS